MLGMGWVRFHKRYGVWPGLAALVLQIALSFGHIHIGNIHIGIVHVGGAAQAFGSAVVNSLHNAQGQSAGVTLAQAPQKSPAQNSHHKSGDDDDYCAICASIFLASTAFATQPPLLPVPFGGARIALSFPAEQGAPASRPAFFQSRAPPAA
jgi:hypothetical protein